MPPAMNSLVKKKVAALCLIARATAVAAIINRKI
jgi:hypothetical protein